MFLFLKRFRVLEGTFVDTSPTSPETENSESEEKDRRIPYFLTDLSMNQDWVCCLGGIEKETNSIYIYCTFS
ncbi:hypothetical protein TNCT_544941, partial [Trichonephila clavata]